MQSKLRMHLSRRCGARTRSGSPCRSVAMPNGRCRMHGGMSAGAPKGNKNAFKHGRYTVEAVATRRRIAKLLRDARALVKEVNWAQTVPKEQADGHARSHWEVSYRACLA
jgi:hypothetical protein